MKEIAISIQNVSKEYSISKGKDKFWALQDINLEVEKGTVLGLIGSNGAGKSTLLKVLSRITQPTSGKITLNGRLASLLEVGTGFHPELTGKENIYLNGAILGMSKAEINTHYDEILDFAGVSRFIDTPVKNYSSGMYVRLAFSVAAHLNSDILLVDEVLAVGDVQFQKKCLDKMNEATQSGERTVIFVSHNMNIAKNLCDKIAYLEKGEIVKVGDANEVADHYLNSLIETSTHQTLIDRTDRTGSGEAKLTDIQIVNPTSQHQQGSLISGEPAEVLVSYAAKDQLGKIGSLDFHLNVFNEDGNYLVTLSNEFTGKPLKNMPPSGTLKCKIDKLPLMPGRYFLRTHLFVNNTKADYLFRAVNFEVLTGDFYQSGSFYSKRMPGVFIDQRWEY